MPAFFAYLRNITYYLMFATVAGMIAPAGKYKKFVSLVLGFVLVLLMIQPIAGLLRGDGVPVTQWFEGFNVTDEEIPHSAWWDEYLHMLFEEQLEQQLARLLADNGFELASVVFEYSADFSQITAVRASVSRAAVSQNIPFIRIQPPNIRPIQIGETTETTCPYTAAVKTLISNFYNLPEAHINVNIIY